MGIYIQSTAGLTEGSSGLLDRSSVEYPALERYTYTSKDGISFEVQLHLSKVNYRRLTFEHIEGYISSFDVSSFETDKIQPYSNCLSKSNQEDGWLGQTYMTNKDIVYIVTEYRQSTDTSAPTNSPLAVALSRSSMFADLSRSWSSLIFMSSRLWCPFKSSMSEDL